MSAPVDVQIRRVRADEAALFREVRTRAVHDTPLVFGQTASDQLATTDEAWRSRVGHLATSDHEAAWVAIAADDPVGLIGVYCSAAGLWWVVSVWVDPGHRGGEVLGLLHTALRDWAIERGVRRLQLDVVDTNTRAIRAYERLGYALTGSAMTDPAFPGDRELEMALDLG